MALQRLLGAQPQLTEAMQPTKKALDDPAHHSQPTAMGGLAPRQFRLDASPPQPCRCGSLS
jgi:hypothetical protein